MKTKLSIFLSLSMCALLLFSCKDRRTTPAAVTTSGEETALSVILGESEDMGKEYIDSFVFFGESTTYHLKSRGVLSGGRDTVQVLGNGSGTAILDPYTASTEVIYPETGEVMSFSEAISRKKPKYLFMSFGLNGAVYKLKRGEGYFKDCYRRMIAAVRQASPATKIILGSCYPVAENMDMSNYSLSLDGLNGAIETLNGWTAELCAEEDVRYLNTNEVLTDENGRLRLEYQVGDGHHLTAEAYRKILYYIRTHGYR